MIDAHGAWTKLGPILVPDRRREWMATYTGPSFAVAKPQDGVVDVYVTGRDTQNRSRSGVAAQLPIAELDKGCPGAADESCALAVLVCRSLCYLLMADLWHPESTR